MADITLFWVDGGLTCKPNLKGSGDENVCEDRMIRESRLDASTTKPLVDIGRRNSMGRLQNATDGSKILYVIREVCIQVWEHVQATELRSWELG